MMTTKTTKMMELTTTVKMMTTKTMTIMKLTTTVKMMTTKTTTLPAAPVAADARGESLRANDDGSQVELIYSGESDGGSD